MPKTRAAVWPYAVASLVLMALPSGVTQRTRLAVLGGFGPVRNLANASHSLVESGWERLRPSGHTDDIERQNEFLRSQVVLLLAQHGELAAKLEAATATRAVASNAEYDLIPADVVLNLDSSSFRRTIVIASGTRDGVEPGLPVLYHSHLIGRVLEASPWTSRVLLTTDPGFRARAISVPPTYDGSTTLGERHVGVFEGTGTESGLLKWLAGETPIDEGAYVVTTEDPLNGIPKGLVLGRVTGIDRGRATYPRVQVTPIIDPEGLEFVLILKAKK